MTERSSVGTSSTIVASSLCERFLLERHVWLAPHAASILQAFLEEQIPKSTTLHRVTTQQVSWSHPGILVLTANDVAHPIWRKPLLNMAHRIAPGRPVIYGGTQSKEILLDAINVWRAFRIVPETVPLSTVTDAIFKAHEALHAQVALASAVEKYEIEARALRKTLDDLETTQENLLRSERLATVGRVTGALSTMISSSLDDLEKLNQTMELEINDPELTALRKGALDGFHATRVLLDEIASYVEHRDIDYALESCDVALLLERAIAFSRFDPLSKQRHVSLAIVEKVHARIDRYRMFHVLINLLRNALQATPPKGRIELRLRREERACVIEVEDSGIGMSQAVQERLFTPFFSTKGQQGLGLGLHMSKTTVEKHGGALSCQSQEGVGTTFRILLPTES